jgi:hypothetical protein
MDLLFSFVKPDHPHSTLLSGYFSKVLNFTLIFYITNLSLKFPTEVCFLTCFCYSDVETSSCSCCVFFAKAEVSLITYLL